MTKVNLVGGMNRLFVVLSILWTPVVLVGMPIHHVNEQADLAARYFSQSLDAEYQEVRDNYKALYDSTMETATRGYFYKHVIGKPWWGLFIILILPPLVLYLLVRTFIASRAWVIRGFAKP